MAINQNRLIHSVLILTLSVCLPAEAFANAHAMQTNTFHSTTTQQAVDVADSQATNSGSQPQDPHATFMASNTISSQNANQNNFAQDYLDDLQTLKQDYQSWIKSLEKFIKIWKPKMTPLEDKFNATFEMEKPVKYLVAALGSEEVLNKDCPSFGCVTSDEMDQLNNDRIDLLGDISKGLIDVSRYVDNLEWQLGRTKEGLKKIEEKIQVVKDLPANIDEGLRDDLLYFKEATKDDLKSSKKSLIEPKKKAVAGVQLANDAFEAYRNTIDAFRNKVQGIVDKWEEAYQNGNFEWTENFLLVRRWLEAVNGEYKRGLGQL